MFCGGLMIGVDISELNILLLVIVKLLFCSLVNDSLLLWFLSVSFLIFFLIFVMFSVLVFLSIGVIRLCGVEIVIDILK